MKMLTLSPRVLRAYNFVYLAAITCWIAAWWFFGLRAWTTARVSPGFAIFVEFAWMPFGVAQVYLMQAAMKVEVAACAVAAEELRASLAEIVAFRERIAGRYGEPAEAEGPTLQ